MEKLLFYGVFVVLHNQQMTVVFVNYIKIKNPENKTNKINTKNTYKNDQK